MKKSTFILAAVAVSFALVGCEKKSSAEQQSSGELIEKTFYANQGGKEKTTLDPATLATLWSEGDAIKVYSEAGGAGNDFTLESGEGESAATFTGLTTPSDFYVAFYPAENAKSISGSTVTFNIPATQTVTNAGSFDTNTVPMVGYTTDETLAMMNVGSLFELGLKAKEGTPTVVKIELVGNNGEKLAGDFTVDASVSGQPTAEYSANGATTLTVNCGEYSDSKYQGTALNASDYTYFYISIPAGVFTNGFTAILTNQEGKTAEVTTSENISKGAAKITAFTADDVEFTNCRHCLYTEKVTDICGNTYNLVTIGEQTWMAENMRCDKYDTNSEKAGTTLSTSSKSTNDPYYTPTRSGDPEAYGYYYNWTAAMGYVYSEARKQKGAYDGTRQGICPNGFHIPSCEEFSTLKTAAGSQPGEHLKSCDGWNNYGSNDGNGDNETCFAALPVGEANGSSVTNVGDYAYFWSSDNTNTNSPRCYYLKNSSFGLNLTRGTGTYPYSVRCLRNN